MNTQIQEQGPTVRILAVVWSVRYSWLDSNFLQGVLETAPISGRPLCAAHSIAFFYGSSGRV